MTSSETPRLDRLAELEERLAEAQRKARALGTEQAEQRRVLEQLKTERIRAYSEDDERAAAALVKKTTSAEAKAEQLVERQQGADLAARRAEQERDRYIVDNYAALVLERAPRAHAAVAKIHSAVELLEEGRRDWLAEEQAQHALLRPVPGRNGRHIPSLEINQVIRDLIRAVDQRLVPPLPSGRVSSAVMVADHDSPDPEVRQPARARMMAEVGELR